MLPVLFQLGSFKLHSWGLLLLVGFLAAVWHGAKRAPRYRIEPGVVWDCALAGLFGGVFGGRLAYVLLNFKQYAAHPAEILMIWTGGMTSFGGIIGGVLVGVLMAIRRGIKPGDAADLAGVSLPVGLFFGRVGCFLNGCCYGDRCELPWAADFHPEGHPPVLHVHPTQLYEALGALLIFLVLIWRERHRRVPGELLCLFALLYGIVRFLVEFHRAQEGPSSVIAGLSTGQWASVAAALIAGGIWALLAMRHKNRGQ